MLVDWLLAVATAASVIVPITGLATGIALKRHAVRRYLAWVGCFVTLGLVALGAFVVAQRRAERWSAVRSTVLNVSPSTAVPVVALPGVAATVVLQNGAPSAVVPRGWVAVGHALRLVWLVGVAMLALRVLRRSVSAWSLGRVATPLPPNATAELLAEPRDLLGLRRPVSIKLVPVGSTEAIGTVGLWRPVVFLPRGAVAWPTGRQRRVLMHELSHVANGDWAIRIGVDLIVALLWFHPFVWEASRQLRLEQERVADDVVLRDEHDPYSYATDLVDLAAAGQHSPSGGSPSES
jgi:beta-lactamase regulating signal transducer with metallopeptidase domain